MKPDTDKWASVGDTIECVTVTQTDTPMYPAGTRLAVVVGSREGAAYANELIAAGRWRKKQEPKP